MRNEKQEFVDYYRVLGVSPTATMEEVRRAWREGAMQWHPDRNAGPYAAERIRLVNEAWGELGDQDRRAHYDRVYRAFRAYKRTYRPSGREKRHAADRESLDQLVGHTEKAAHAPRRSGARRRRRNAVIIGFVAAVCVVAVLVTIGLAIVASDRPGPLESDPATALHRLIQRGDVRAWEVQALLDAGTSLTALAGSWGDETALTMAARRGASATVLELLIGPGVLELSPFALIELLNGCPDGYVRRKPTQFSHIKVLVDAGALEHAPHWSNPVDRAAANGCSEIVLELLVNSGRQGPSAGRLALHYVLERDVADLSQVQLLVNAGAPLDTTNHQGKTPLEIALDQRHPRSIVDLLIPRK